MLELDLILICQIIVVAIAIYILATQVIIPFYKKEPLFPKFRSKDALIAQREHTEELERELKIVEEEERQVDLESDLLTRRESIKSKRKGAGDDTK